MVLYRMTGGKARDKLVGADQLLLSIVLYIYHNASADELCAFLVANGRQVYSRQKIQRGVQNWSSRGSVRQGKHMMISRRTV